MEIDLDISYSAFKINIDNWRLKNKNTYYNFKVNFS